jgi:prevent-host-death family protein
MPELRASKRVGAYAAKIHFSELLNRVESGEEVTIVKHGTPVAKMVPLTSQTVSTQTISELDCWTDALDGLSLAESAIRELIDEGRR